MYTFLRHHLIRAFCMFVGVFFAMALLLTLLSADDPASRGDWWTPGLDYYMQAYAPHSCLASGVLLLAYVSAYVITALLERRERAAAQPQDRRV